jgi:Protein of unknown function (DUF2795)
MERGSSKHGPRLDEQMENEVRGLLQGQPGNDRVEEWHDPEPSGEDQPEAAQFPEPELDRRGGAPEGITVEETEQRAEFASYLHRSLFPAERGKLRRAAEEAHAPDWVVAAIERLPEGQEFPNVSEAWAAAGGGIESQRW